MIRTDKPFNKVVKKPILKHTHRYDYKTVSARGFNAKFKAVVARKGGEENKRRISEFFCLGSFFLIFFLSNLFRIRQSVDRQSNDLFPSTCAGGRNGCSAAAASFVCAPRMQVHSAANDINESFIVFGTVDGLNTRTCIRVKNCTKTNGRFAEKTDSHFFTSQRSVRWKTVSVIPCVISKPM